MNRSTIRYTLLALLAFLSGCMPSPSSQAIRTRIYLCTRTTKYQAPNTWHYPNTGHHHPRIADKGVPVYRLVVKRWIEIFLPQHGLSVRYRKDSFFDATASRYTPSHETIKMSVREDVLRTRRSSVVQAEVLTSATELNAFVLTDEARARLRDSLDNYLKLELGTEQKDAGDKQ